MANRLQPKPATVIRPHLHIAVADKGFVDLGQLLIIHWGVGHKESHIFAIRPASKDWFEIQTAYYRKEIARLKVVAVTGEVVFDGKIQAFSIDLPVDTVNTGFDVHVQIHSTPVFSSPDALIEMQERMLPSPATDGEG